MNRSTVFMFLISWVTFQDRISVLLSDGGIVACLISLFNFYILQALHHPFTAPNPEDLDDLASARALAYDMVYNGVEVIIYLFILSIFWYQHT
jgi:hypothetical protein